jgi:hypothetical protein
LLTTLYQTRDVSIPVAFELIKKMEWAFDERKKKCQRKSPQTKNELYCRMLKACIKNRIEFRCVLSNVWFASSENMRCLKEGLGKEFIMPLKANRKVALSLEARKRGEYRQVTFVKLEPETEREDYLEQV